MAKQTVRKLVSLKFFLRFYGHNGLIQQKEMSMKTSKMILNLIAGICLSQGVLAADIPSMVPSPNLEGLFKECGEAKNSKGVSQILDTFSQSMKNSWML